MYHHPQQQVYQPQLPGYTSGGSGSDRSRSYSYGANNSAAGYGSAGYGAAGAGSMMTAAAPPELLIPGIQGISTTSSRDSQQQHGGYTDDDHPAKKMRPS
eukprot:8783-Heterococcus_DN1.PRE.3